MSDYPDDLLVDDTVTAWCQDGHRPKLINERHTSIEGLHACPECGRLFDVESDPMLIDVTDEVES